MKPKIITITGELGSGKSSTANGLAALLGYTRFSAGDFQRAAAASLGLTYDEYQKVAEQDPQYDHRADDEYKKIDPETGSVIDGRLAYHFLPDSYKVFLSLPPTIAAERILKDAAVNPDRHKEIRGGASDVATIAGSIIARKESERHRYKKYYGVVDPFDPANFDLIIDTSGHPLTEVIQLVSESYEKWLSA